MDTQVRGNPYMGSWIGVERKKKNWLTNVVTLHYYSRLILPRTLVLRGRADVHRFWTEYDRRDLPDLILEVSEEEVKPSRGRSGPRSNKIGISYSRGENSLKSPDSSWLVEVSFTGLRIKDFPKTQTDGPKWKMDSSEPRTHSINRETRSQRREPFTSTSTHYVYCTNLLWTVYHLKPFIIDNNGYRFKNRVPLLLRFFVGMEEDEGATRSCLPWDP